MMTPRLLRLVRLLLLLMMTVSTGAVNADTEVYKWVDEDGNIHYCDTPPAGVEVERVEVDSPPCEPASASESKALETAGDRYRRLVKEREAAAGVQAAAERAAVEREKRCSYLRKQLISLQQKLPVYRDETGKFRTVSRYDAYAGEREYLDDAVRQKEIKRVAGEIALVCADPLNRAEQAVAAWERSWEKRCEYARQRLALLQEEGARTPRQELEEAQSEVDLYCDDKQ